MAFLRSLWTVLKRGVEPKSSTKKKRSFDKSTLNAIDGMKRVDLYCYLN